ncbi:MAG: hypothetical protein AAF530_15435 [Pseudomonadota bacterium]
MLGIFGIFGRSKDLKRLDQALLGVSLSPWVVPEAVKLAVLKLLADAGMGRDPAGEAAAAELLGYCLFGAREFTEYNSLALTEAVENRIAAALEAGDSLDAQIVLLALHANVLHPSVIETFALSVD